MRAARSLRRRNSRLQIRFRDFLRRRLLAVFWPGATGCCRHVTCDDVAPGFTPHCHAVAGQIQGIAKDVHPATTKPAVAMRAGCCLGQCCPLARPISAAGIAAHCGHRSDDDLFHVRHLKCGERIDGQRVNKMFGIQQPVLATACSRTLNLLIRLVIKIAFDAKSSRLCGAAGPAAVTLIVTSGVPRRSVANAHRHWRIAAGPP